MRLSEERYDNPAYRDIKNSIDTAKEEGREEGLKEGEYQKSLSVARVSLENGLPLDIVAKITGLELSIIERLKKELELKNN